MSRGVRVMGLVAAVGVMLTGATTAFAQAAPNAITPRQKSEDLVKQATAAVVKFSRHRQAVRVTDALKRGRAAFIVPSFARESGEGVLLRKDPETSAWSAPAFYQISGARLGPRTETDPAALLIVIENEQTLTDIVNGEMGLGGGAKAGSSASPDKDGSMAKRGEGAKPKAFALRTDVLASVILEGGTMGPMAEFNRAYYNEKATPMSILIAPGMENNDAKPLQKALAELTGTRDTARRQQRDPERRSLHSPRTRSALAWNIFSITASE